MDRMISIPRIFGKFIKNTYPNVNYIFGDASYIREQIVNFKSSGLSGSFPLVGLYWTSSDKVEMNVKRDIPMKASLSFIVAESSTRDANEVRMEAVYENVLYPMVEKIISSIETSGLFEFGPLCKASFSYSDGYETPFHGLVDNTGKDLAEIVDFVSVKNLILQFRKDDCKLSEFLNND